MEKSTWIKQIYTFQLITMDEPYLDCHLKHIKDYFLSNWGNGNTNKIFNNT